LMMPNPSFLTFYQTNLPRECMRFNYGWVVHLSSVISTYNQLILTPPTISI
jgi:hypothetical protein